MFKRWRAFLAKHRAEPEESITYRVAVTVLVMFCLLLTLHQLEWPSYWPAVLLLTPGASVMSYYRRSYSNVWIKIFLSFAMIFLLLWFFTRLARTLYDPRLPLAELLIWLQTLHAFDLPAKKDLRYTGLVALILMAIACVLTYSSYFALWLLIFGILFLAVMAIDFWAGNRTPTTILQVKRKTEANLDFSWLGKTVAKTLPLAMLGAALIFLFMPRYQGLKLRSLPVSWDMNFSLGQVSGGEIVNRSLSKTPSNSNGKPQRIDGDSYFGFDSEVNLNARGRLSDTLVMKVRTSNWQYHRGVTFSEYTGVGWKGLPWEPITREVAQPPHFFPSVNWKDERVTIYYAEVDLPNIIFTPSNPRRLFFPSNEVFSLYSFDRKTLPKNAINTPATLVSPFYVEKGAVYSVLNQMPASGTRILSQQTARDFDHEQPPYLHPFLELPPSVTPRTIELARSIAAKHKSPWGRAAALCSYLQQNYTYDLDVDFYPEGADTADHFLFEAKLGYCEQFATTLCVMARSVGLPSRYVTGYLPGQYNPVSGFYEVKASDAHAWAEIYFKGFGWMIFDPVPGGSATPQLGEPPQNRWLLESLLEYWQVPDELRRLLPNLLRLLIALTVISLIFALFYRSRRKAPERLSPFAEYLRKAEALTETRPKGETVRQWAERLKLAPLLALADVYEERFYRDLPLEKDDREILERSLEELRERDS